MGLAKVALYRGYVFRWGIPTESRGDVVQGWDQLVSSLPNITIRSRFPPAVGNTGEWLEGTYESEVAISDAHKEDPKARNSRGFFEYPILFRATKQATVIIGSSGTKVVKHFADLHVNSQPYPELVQMRIRVERLANHLILEDREKYSVSSLSVNVDAAGVNLERADYYGQDLAAAKLIYENLEHQTPFMIGLRRKESGSSELIRVGSRGYIQLSFPERPPILEIEEILSMLWSKFYH